MSIISLRFSYIQRPEDYVEELRLAWADPGRNTMNLWAYIDARDVALSCRLALEAQQPGFDAFYIAAPDTLMREPTLELVERYFPGVEQVAEGFGGRMSPLDCRHAEQGLGFKAQYTWEMVTAQAAGAS
jgi:nucleoside-diphosphate-sugar epimerase